MTLEEKRARDREYCRLYRARHPQRVKRNCRLRMREWRSRNPGLSNKRAKIYAAKQRAADPQKIRDRKNAWRQQNLEAARAQKRRSYIRNKENIKAKVRAYIESLKADSVKYAAYRLRCTQATNAYRAKTRSAAGSHTLQQWLERVAFYGWRCAYCGKRLSDKTLTKDHVIPVVRNGPEFASNLVPACKRCNVSKGKRHRLPHRWI